MSLCSSRLHGANEKVTETNYVKYELKRGSEGMAPLESHEEERVCNIKVLKKKGLATLLLHFVRKVGWCSSCDSQEPYKMVGAIIF